MLFEIANDSIIPNKEERFVKSMISYYNSYTYICRLMENDFRLQDQISALRRVQTQFVLPIRLTARLPLYHLAPSNLFFITLLTVLNDKEWLEVLYDTFFKICDFHGSQLLLLTLLKNRNKRSRDAFFAFTSQLTATLTPIQLIG